MTRYAKKFIITAAPHLRALTPTPAGAYGGAHLAGHGVLTAKLKFAAALKGHGALTATTS